MTTTVFMGTPVAAVPTLEALAGSTRVTAVITQPDRPRGRSGAPEATPVKRRALELDLPVAEPDSADALNQVMTGLGPVDVGVVVAYGRILRREVIEVPAAGFLNVHFSLLPRWRGAAPVNRAIMAGDSMTGVTLIKIDEGLDTGPVLNAQAIDIGSDETAGNLTGRLSVLGARLLVDSLPRYLAGEIIPVEQSSDGLTYAAKIESSERAIDLTLQPREVVNHVRGLSPAPAATLLIDGVAHKILMAEITDEHIEPGTWALHDSWPIVGVSDGAIRVLQIQAPGRSAVAADAWARGLRVDSGLVA